MSLEKFYVIYMFTSPSGKKYIGQTCDLERRIREHSIRDACVAFAAARDKYGFENFILEVIEENLTLEEANIQEEFYITYHNSISPNGYNLQSGGLNRLHSEETKLKMSENHADINGENNPFYGKLHTDETLKMLSSVKKGENNPMYGKVGKDCPSYGKVGELSHSSKTYKITFPNGDIQIIKGLTQFCKEYNLNQAHMSVRGKTKGFMCELYIGDDLSINYTKRQPDSEVTKERKYEANAKIFRIIFPDGHEEVIKGLGKFCKEHNISAGSMSGRGYANGYKLIRLSEEI